MMESTQLGRSSGAGKLLRVLKRLFLSVAALLLILILALTVVLNTQDGTIKLIQMAIYGASRADVNVDAPRTRLSESVREDGIRVKSDLRYADRYPNSFLDIWYSAPDKGRQAPTIVFIHGGGWFAGAKNAGDPMAGGEMGMVIEPLAKRGYNVVSIDYALAPEYRYPVPMIQLNEALSFLRNNAPELKLDMTNVIIMGGSAGAQMAAQYGVLLSDAGYAEEVGVRPSLQRSDVKGLVLYSAPFKTTGLDWRASRILWAYLGTKDIDGSVKARQLDLLPRINPRYPPTYLTDGNQADTFPEHAKAMARALQANDVPHVFTYFEPQVVALDHGYSGRIDTKYGRENFERTVDFIQSRTRRE